MNDSTTTDTTKYVATFTLTQDGLAGEVTPSLEFLPLVSPGDEETPAIYEYMSTMALKFLQQVRVIDEHFNPINENSLDGMELNVLRPLTKH